MELTLRNRFVRGSRLYYLSSTNVTQKIIDGDTLRGSHTAGWKMEIHQRVLEVEPEGDAHVVYRVIPVSLSPEATATGLMIRKQVVYMRVTPSGRIVEQSGDGLVDPCRFPDHPVHLGETWEVESALRLPQVDGPVHYVNEHTLSAIDDLDGVTCARINVRSQRGRLLAPCAGPAGTIEVEVENEGSVWFDHEDGTLVCVRMTTRAVPVIDGVRYDTLTTTTQQLITEPVPVGVG